MWMQATTMNNKIKTKYKTTTGKKLLMKVALGEATMSSHHSLKLKETDKCVRFVTFAT